MSAPKWRMGDRFSYGHDAEFVYIRHGMRRNPKNGQMGRVADWELEDDEFPVVWCHFVGAPDERVHLDPNDFEKHARRI